MKVITDIVWTIMHVFLNILNNFQILWFLVFAAGITVGFAEEKFFKNILNIKNGPILLYTNDVRVKCNAYYQQVVKASRPEFLRLYALLKCLVPRMLLLLFVLPEFKSKTKRFPTSIIFEPKMFCDIALTLLI